MTTYTRIPTTARRDALDDRRLRSERVLFVLTAIMGVLATAMAAVGFATLGA